MNKMVIKCSSKTPKNMPSDLMIKIQDFQDLIIEEIELYFKFSDEENKIKSDIKATLIKYDPNNVEFLSIFQKNSTF